MTSKGPPRPHTAPDTLFRSDQPHLVDFQFNADVVSVFPDMIRRSVPGYETVLPITGLIAAAHLPTGGVLYDLGCSQGASTSAVLQSIGDRQCSIIAVDNSTDMLDSARRALTDSRVAFVEADIAQLDYQPCDVVLLNYILQFVNPQNRLALLRQLHDALAPDGVLLLSEKIHLDDAAVDAQLNELHLEFKRANGYTEMEIAAKRSALENVMIIDSEAQHLQRLRQAGFSRVTKWFQCLNWASFIIQP